MAHSIIEYPYGVTGPYAVNFTLGFLSRSHVTAFVRGELDSQGNQVYRDISWVDDGLINIAGALPYGSMFVISRDTPAISLIHDYQDGAVLNEQNLDESNLQSLMLMQELHDGKRSDVLYGELDANTFRLTNLAPGVAGSDAVTMAQLGVVNALAQTTVDRVEAAAAGVVVSSLEVAANLLVSTAALAETRDLANVVSASAATVEGLAEEVLVTAAAQAVSYTASVQEVQLAGQAIKVDSLQLVQEEIGLAEARATEAALVQDSANSTAIAACTDQRVLSESSAISAAASASIATTATGAFASIHADAITQLEPMVAAVELAVSLSQASAVDSEQSRVASDVSAAAAKDSAVHAEEQVVLAGIESSRAAAYANATGNSLSITSSISDIVGDVIDLEYLVLQASAFTNENYPLLRMDLAAESDVLDLGGLT